MPVRTVLAESNDQQSSRFLDELLAGKSVPATFEAQLKTKSGGTKDVILSTSPIEIGGKTGFMAVVTDITKRKQAEDALGRSEEKFRTLANNLNVGIFRRTIGPNPKFIEANPALVKLLGYASKEELLAHPGHKPVLQPRRP